MGNLGYGYSLTHQGEMLKEEIESRNISQKIIAEQDGHSLHCLK